MRCRDQQPLETAGICGLDTPSKSTQATRLPVGSKVPDGQELLIVKELTSFSNVVARTLRGSSRRHSLALSARAGVRMHDLLSKSSAGVASQPTLATT